LLVGKCRLFRTKLELLGQPYKVKPSVSMDSMRAFVGAIGGAVAEISEANVRHLSQLCGEFEFIELAKTVGNWQAGHPHIDSVIRRELNLVGAARAERLESQARTMSMLDEALHRRREAAMTNAEKLSAQTDHCYYSRTFWRSPAARGFDLVAGVISKSTASHSNLRPSSIVLLQILQ
jgi:hypothetical protein